jgi:hypothetical protein
VSALLAAAASTRWEGSIPRGGSPERRLSSRRSGSSSAHSSAPPVRAAEATDGAAATLRDRCLLILAVFSSVLALPAFFRLISSVGPRKRHRLLPHPCLEPSGESPCFRSGVWRRSPG